MRHKPVARVTLAMHASVATEDYSSLFRSDTNRAPYTQAPLTTSQTNALTALADSSAWVLAASMLKRLSIPSCRCHSRGCSLRPSMRTASSSRGSSSHSQTLSSQ